ncbi:hemolysin family protein [Fodinibius halophilus]|uniref:HlyC/CorC family transporter n=1 Tax=Fodinibius halophilus TaxID=1736908 RepID=A0A6M1T2F5_9BACT|nr:hemolysin family protein [Fodinibius halophilus]NGP86803.1 HlyC/CorC family transporter [Fodinibius halophilus]
MDDPSSLLFIVDFLIQAEENFLFEPTINPIEFTIQIGCILLGLFFSALFSGSEVAFFSLSNQEDLLTEGDIEGTADRLIVRMLEQPRQLLATILIGNTFANIIASVLAAVVAGNIMAYYGLGEFLVYLIEVIVLTFMILILSEITPKIIAINNPLKATRRMSRFIYTFFILFKPLSKLIASSTLSLEERLPKLTSKMTSEDIMTMAEVSEQEGSIKSDEREIIENVIEFGSTTVREIMTSRVDIVAISMGNSLDEVLSLIRKEGLSRMPIYENDLDNILGVIHSKDVLPYINSDIERTTINWRTIARKALFIPATKKLDDLLRDFQQEKTHIAIVVDEYGGTEGLITLDDILEEIVGDISDEYDEDEDKLYTKFKSGVYIFDARIDLDDMEDILDRELTSDDDQYETLGGLVYHLTERIPNVGERVYYKNLELTIHSVQNNRVRKLRVKVQDRPASSKEHQQTKE